MIRRPRVAPQGVVDVDILHGRSYVRRQITDHRTLVRSKVDTFDFLSCLVENRLLDDDGLIMNTYCLE